MSLLSLKKDHNPITVPQTNLKVLFSKEMMTSPRIFSSFFNLKKSTNCNTSFDSTARKRKIEDITDGSKDSNNGKRKNVEALNSLKVMDIYNKIRIKSGPKNEDFQRTLNFGYAKVISNNCKIFSCFIGSCRFKTTNIKRFNIHLQYFHCNLQEVLQGFCLICDDYFCGRSTFEEFVHLYGHVNGLSSSKFVNEAVYIKKEAECEIMDTTLCNEQSLRDEEMINDDGQSTFLQFNHTMSFDVTHIIPLEPESDLNNKKVGTFVKQEAIPIEEPMINIKREPIEANEADDNEDSKSKSLHNVNHEMSFQYDSNQNIEHEEMLLIPISPKTVRKRKKTVFVPSTERNLRSRISTSSSTSPKSNSSEDLEANDCLEFISKKIIDAKNKRKSKDEKTEKHDKTVGKCMSLKLRKSDEEKLNKKFSEEIIMKVNASSSIVDSQNATSMPENPKNGQNIKEENKSQSSSSKKLRKTILNSSELQKTIYLEDVHPKYQQNPNVNPSTSAQVLKNSTSQQSINESISKSLDSSNKSQEYRKAAYTVDIEALISKASSNFEFSTVQNLYPWINEATSSVIFKSKSSMDILLNELCLFSTYKCMNEVCFFFTTDFEDFKMHSKKHYASNNYCSYCLKNFEKYEELCNHLDMVHKFDRFQCNKCMYRSCQKGYVDTHQLLHHSKEDNCEVLKSPVQKLLKSDRSKCLTYLQKNRLKYVMPYKCKSK